jgi:small subunit ribosomal protein S17e
MELNVMGKVRTDSVKRISNKILRNFPDRFTKDFDENKKILSQDIKIDVKSKRLRNRIVGYVTHLVKIREDDSIVVTEE